MQKIVVEGGVPLRGEVRVSGAKNAVLPILCAGLLADGPLLVRNVPNLQDVKTTIRVLAELGAGIRLDDAFDGRPVSVPSKQYRRLVLGARLLPRPMLHRIMARRAF